MIFSTNLESFRKKSYYESLKNLEKAKALLNEKFENKEISNEEYIKQCHNLDSQIENLKRLIGE